MKRILFLVSLVLCLAFVTTATYADVSPPTDVGYYIPTNVMTFDGVEPVRQTVEYPPPLQSITTITYNKQPLVDKHFETDGENVRWENRYNTDN